MTDTRAAYLSRKSLANELDMAESTVDEMVRKGVLPRPIKLSSGCVRWRWDDVDTALSSINRVEVDGVITASDPYVRGIHAAKASQA